MKLAAAVLLLGCGDNNVHLPDAGPISLACEPAYGTNVVATPIATIPGTITLVTSPPNDPRLFVVMESGTILIVQDGKLLPQPFLDLRDLAPAMVGGDGSESGLLGLAFHPQFATNHTLFINYTGVNNDPTFTQADITMRLEVGSDPNRADPATAAILLSIPDFASNHNGGMLEFGPDGYLYVGAGDGGGANDPMRTAQDPRRLLGKISRIDVDARSPGLEYGIPPDNPFADGVDGLPEIFILGVRNPWRFSFDTQTGDLWIGDVGQNQYEELDVLPAGAQGGANLGWSTYEGNHCFYGPCTNSTGFVFPKDERSHDDGWCAVIGGSVYRGACYPDIVGEYFYSDYCRGGLTRARLLAGGTLDILDLPGALPTRPASMHHDARGEIYITNSDGIIYHLEATP